MFANRNVIQSEPGPIIGPIARIFGAILDFLFEFAYMITPTEVHTLGISIILLTFVVIIVTFPLTHKSQKSMQAMQKLAPEMDKIKKKYENRKSQEDQKKMSQEMNKLYSENGANPLMGCLPMFIQMPVFFSVFHIMRQPYRYVSRLGDVYTRLAETIIAGFNVDAAGAAQNPEGLQALINLAYRYGIIPDRMEFSFTDPDQLRRMLALFDPYQWDYFMNSISADVAAQIQPYLTSKMNLEHFIGIDLVENVGFAFPVILIPIACVAFTFLTSYMTQKNQAKPTDPQQKMQQTMMLVVMPAMMGVITFGMPAGVGLYWATSSALRIIQQHFTSKLTKPKTEVTP